MAKLKAKAVTVSEYITIHVIKGSEKGMKMAVGKQSAVGFTQNVIGTLGHIAAKQL